MTDRSARREHPRDTNDACRFQHLGEVTEGEITVVERPHVLASCALVVVDGSIGGAGNTTRATQLTVVMDEGLPSVAKASGRKGRKPVTGPLTAGRVHAAGVVDFEWSKGERAQDLCRRADVFHRQVSQRLISNRVLRQEIRRGGNARNARGAGAGQCSATADDCSSHWRKDGIRPIDVKSAANRKTVVGCERVRDV